MSVFNKSYLPKLKNHYANIGGVKSAIAIELAWVQYLVNTHKPNNDILIFLYKYGEVYQTVGHESFEAFSKYQHSKKIVLDFTSIWLDPQVCMQNSMYDTSNEIYKCLTKVKTFTQKEIEDRLAQFLQGNAPWTYLLRDTLAKQSNSKVVAVMEYPKIMKDIYIDFGLESSYMAWDKVICSPLHIPNYVCLSETHFVPIGMHKYEYTLTGVDNTFVYPIRKLCEQEMALETLYVRKKPANFNYLDFKAEHTSFMNDLNKSKFSICTPSIMELPVYKYYESMCMGAVVVTPRFKYMEDYGLIENETCLVFDPLGDIKSQLENLPSDVTFLDSIRSKAFDYVVENRSFNAIYSKLEKLYLP